MNLSIVDFDSLLFQSATDSLEESILKLKDKAENIIEKTKADYWCGFITSGKCFRYNIFPEYKQNRTRPLPKYFKALKEYAIAEYDLNQCVEYEADDAVKYWYNKQIYFGVWLTEDRTQIDGLSINPEDFLNIYENSTGQVNKIICAIDKDILQSVPGKHFNYTYKAGKLNPDISPSELDEVVKGWWVETDAKSAERFKWTQVLMGDSADNVSALSGVGIKTAEKMIEGVEYYPESVLSRYISHHKSVSKGIYEYSKNYRLLHMLENDEDFMQEVGHLPEFPKINKVNKVVKEIIDF